MTTRTRSSRKQKLNARTQERSGFTDLQAASVAGNEFGNNGEANALSRLRRVGPRTARQHMTTNVLRHPRTVILHAHAEQ